jgi:hypothetical protein
VRLDIRHDPPLEHFIEQLERVRRSSPLAEAIHEHIVRGPIGRAAGADHPVIERQGKGNNTAVNEDPEDGVVDEGSGAAPELALHPGEGVDRLVVPAGGGVGEDERLECGGGGPEASGLGVGDGVVHGSVGVGGEEDGDDGAGVEERGAEARGERGEEEEAEAGCGRERGAEEGVGDGVRGEAAREEGEAWEEGGEQRRERGEERVEGVAGVELRGEGRGGGVDGGRAGEEGEGERKEGACRRRTSHKVIEVDRGGQRRRQIAAAAAARAGEAGGVVRAAKTRRGRASLFAG